MKHIYFARDFFKSALINNYSSYTGESIGFFGEAFEKASSRSRPIDPDYALLSVSTYNGNALRLNFNLDAGCDGGVCECLKSNIAKRFAIPPNQIITTYGRMAQAQLQRGQPVGHQNMITNSYGTLGGFIIDKNQHRSAQIVSNNHVLANSNEAAIGDYIYSRYSLHRPIGILNNFVEIDFYGRANTLDIATASLYDDVQVSAAAYRTVRQPYIGENVTKVGATTGFTRGIVRSVDETVRVGYGDYYAVFQDQISITGVNINQPFSKPGDSGSFIMADDGSFIGLLFAGDNLFTHANHGQDVAEQLRDWNLLDE